MTQYPAPEPVRTRAEAAGIAPAGAPWNAPSPKLKIPPSNPTTQHPPPPAAPAPTKPKTPPRGGPPPRPFPGGGAARRARGLLRLNPGGVPRGGADAEPVPALATSPLPLSVEWTARPLGVRSAAAAAAAVTRE